MADRDDTGGAWQPGQPRPLARGVLTHLVGFHLRAAQARVFQDFARAAEGSGVTPGQFGVLALIKANTGLSQSELGKNLGVDRSTVVAVIGRLEQRGLAQRTAARHDRRSYALRLTDYGETVMHRMEQALQRQERQVTARLTGQERLQLIDLLDRLGTAEEDA